MLHEKWVRPGDEAIYRKVPEVGAMARYILCADWVWRTGRGVTCKYNNIIVHTRYRRQGHKMLPSVPFACAVRLRGSLRAKAELHL